MTTTTERTAPAEAEHEGEGEERTFEALLLAALAGR